MQDKTWQRSCRLLYVRVICGRSSYIEYANGSVIFWNIYTNRVLVTEYICIEHLTSYLNLLQTLSLNVTVRPHKFIFHSISCHACWVYGMSHTGLTGSPNSCWWVLTTWLPSWWQTKGSWLVYKWRHVAIDVCLWSDWDILQTGCDLILNSIIRTDLCCTICWFRRK